MAACQSIDIQQLSKDLLLLDMSDTESINNAVNKFSTIIYKACDIAGVRRVQVGKKKQRGPKAKNNKKWFDKDCTAMKKELKYLARCKSRDPFSLTIREKYHSVYKKYKSLLRRKKKHFQSSIMDRMNNLYDKNQKAYWQAVKDMSDFCRSNDGNPIPVDTWIEHFTNLMSDTNIGPNNDFTQYINSKVINRPAIFNELDYRITQSEVLKAIKKLKRGKAASVDGILNEMLKDMSPLMVQCVTKLFNGILSVGSFPDSWRLNLLSTAHKKGSKFVCGNYRGLAIGNNLAKVFCSVLNSRIYDFAMDNNLIPVHQIGFKRKSRPADHILTLKCIIDKYIKKANGKLFVCFIDLSKAYDRVWREGLFFKLINCGIGGKTINILIDMYKQVKFSLKYNGKMTDYFNSEIGLKQGCVLSPLLFNLYMNDVPSLFKNGCQPVEIDGLSVNILMFADDIVLMSTDPAGLQSCIDNLHNYCTKWKLVINIDKSKVMVFNKSGRSYSGKYQFNIGSAILDIVSEYSYLGIIFQPSGLFTGVLGLMGNGD